MLIFFVCFLSIVGPDSKCSVSSPRVCSMVNLDETTLQTGMEYGTEQWFKKYCKMIWAVRDVFNVSLPWNLLLPTRSDQRELQRCYLQCDEAAASYVFTYFAPKMLKAKSGHIHIKLALSVFSFVFFLRLYSGALWRWHQISFSDH